MYFPKTASVAINTGGFQKFVAAGTLTPCISDTGEYIVGVSRETYAASDTTTKQIAIEVPTELYVEWEFDTDSDGGLADSDVGNYRDLDTTGTKLDASASTDKMILVTKCLSTTKGIGVLAKTAISNFQADT